MDLDIKFMTSEEIQERLKEELELYVKSGKNKEFLQGYTEGYYSGVTIAYLELANIVSAVSTLGQKQKKIDEMKKKIEEQKTQSKQKTQSEQKEVKNSRKTKRGTKNVDNN